MRRAQNQQMRARLPSPPCPPAELPLVSLKVNNVSINILKTFSAQPQTSTLRSRRRLANILVAAGFIYMLCWLPHVCCLVIREFSLNDECSNTTREFFMLLGENQLSNCELFAMCNDFISSQRLKLARNFSQNEFFQSCLKVERM